MSKKILITPKSFKAYKNKAYAIIEEQGYEIIENSTGRTLSENEIVDFAKQDVVGIIVGIDPLPASVLEKCKDLKAVSKYGVGMDNIDMDKARELGISVNNAVGTNNVSVAELAIGLMFTLSRHIVQCAGEVKNGIWERVMGFELTGKKLGLIGGGQIGKEVAKRARGLEMEVTIYDPYFNDESFLKKYDVKKIDDLNSLLSESDVISLHAPVTPDTRGIINEASLGRMKSNAILINTSRGELVDEEALYNALINKRIAGAGQDVFSKEPPGKEEKLLKLDNFILTSHIGAFTHEAVEKMVMVSTYNMLEMLR